MQDEGSQVKRWWEEFVQSLQAAPKTLSELEILCSQAEAKVKKLKAKAKEAKPERPAESRNKDWVDNTIADAAGKLGRALGASSQMISRI